MKKVKSNRKLVLNKETIANLNNYEMSHLVGGNSQTTCRSICPATTCNVTGVPICLVCDPTTPGCCAPTGGCK